MVLASTSTAAAPCARPVCMQAAAPLRRLAFLPVQQSWRTSQKLGRSRHLSVQALQVGERMQDYPDYYRQLKTQDGKSMALSSLEGKKPFVLFFYPKVPPAGKTFVPKEAATPGCTKQACKFRDEYAQFQDAAEVLGISSDPPEVNAEFAKAQNLPFPLLSDTDQLLRKSFGIKGDLLGLLPGRETYVIDKDGVVRLAFNNQFNPEQHVAEALQVLQTLQS